MAVTLSDIVQALDGVSFNSASSTPTVGFEDVVRPVINPDGSYTINKATGASADGLQPVTFSLYTFPNGTVGLTYTVLGGITFYIQAVAFNSKQVLFQGYTTAGVENPSQHFLLTDGGSIQQTGEMLPITLYPTGSSYTTPSGVTITGAPCFGRGTIIATLDGDVLVEDLREGDLVLTVSGEAKPLVWTGSRTVNVARHPRPENVRPVCIRRSAFSPNVPSRDLIVSPDHNVFTDGVLIPAKCLVNGRNVVLQDVETVHYHHIELASHDVVYANGLETETYLDTGNRPSFAGEGVVTAYPDFASAPDQNYFAWEASGYARLVLEGAEVENVRARLAERADELARRTTTRARRSA